MAYVIGGENEPNDYEFSGVVTISISADAHKYCDFLYFHHRD